MKEKLNTSFEPQETSPLNIKGTSSQDTHEDRVDEIQK